MKNDLNQLENLLQTARFTPVQALKLNKQIAQVMKKDVQQKIKTETDIHGKPFSSRKRIAYELFRGKIRPKNKLLQGFAPLIQAKGEKTHAKIQMPEGSASNSHQSWNKIVEIHNHGLPVKSSNGKWYRMTQREFWGISAEAKTQIIDLISTQLTAKTQGA